MNDRMWINHGWLFGGPAAPGSTDPGFDDSGFTPVTLPHAHAVLPAREIDSADYEYVSVYRRHLSLPTEVRTRLADGYRVFACFDGATTAATVVMNGRTLGEYKGGYTPFSYDLTPHLAADTDNLLAVLVDGRRARDDIPPFGRRVSRDGNDLVLVDFDTVGGLTRGVNLRVTPPVFLANVFAKPVDVLGDTPRVDARCYLDGLGADAPGAAADGLSIEVEVRDGNAVLGSATAVVPSGAEVVDLSVTGLSGVQLWDVDSPRLYAVVARLVRDGAQVHSYETRIGFREARFTPEGFFLNGRRLRLFGLNRHEMFPYVGAAMPARVLRRDAEILKRDLSCNVVRTAHYPQSREFLDACDELGLLVWEEIPGWQHVGDEAWQAVAAEHARAMIERDWNHPSIVVWGVRINESERDEPPFYDDLHRLARDLDDSRQTTGAYHKDHPVRQDVHGVNDYLLREYPAGDGPYLFSEAVGQKRPAGDFDRYYRRTDPTEVLQAQAERHAHAHDWAAGDPRCAGVITWAAFDYYSPINSVAGIKTPGVYDMFRIPKPGAALYASQRDPADGFVLEPAFVWDLRHGLHGTAMVCSNCENLEVYIDDDHVATARPDRDRYPHLARPPFVVDLDVDSAGPSGAPPELRIDGHTGGRCVISRRFSADPAYDTLLLRADDRELIGDGIDAVRLVVQAVDRYGSPRPCTDGYVEFRLYGPGEIIGDNPFPLGAVGGAGAVWVRAADGADRRIRVQATHPRLGTRHTDIAVLRPETDT